MSLSLLAASLTGSVLGLLGGVIFLWQTRWSELLSRNAVPFAAGVLITVSLTGLMPEANEIIGEQVFTVVLFTFFAIYLFEHLLLGLHHHQHCQHGRDYCTAVWLVIVGDTIHNLIDGVAIGASFAVNPGLGWVTAWSTFLHEVPHEIGDFGILLAAGWSKRNIIVVNFVSALATLVGAFGVQWLASNQQLIAQLMGVSAGLFLYLGASDFLPHVKELGGSRVRAVLPLVLGVAVMLAVIHLIPHG